MGVLQTARGRVEEQVKLRVERDLGDLVRKIDKSPFAASYQINVLPPHRRDYVVVGILDAINGGKDRRFEGLVAEWVPSTSPLGENDGHILVEPIEKAEPKPQFRYVGG